MRKEKRPQKPELRELRPFIIVAKKQQKTFVLGHNEILNVNGQKIDFTGPNNIAICLSISEREYEISQKMWIKYILPKIKKNQKEVTFTHKQTSKVYDYFEHLQTSIIFAYTAVEAFGNVAIPEEFTYEKTNNKKVKEIWTKENIERWLPTTEKICEILPKILQTSSPKDEKFWLDFKKLEEIRNEIIHQKTVTNELNVSSKYLHEFFSSKIFDIIRSGFLVIEYFCSKTKFAHVYFPLGVGTAKQQPIIVDDFETHFAPKDKTKG